MLISGCKSNLSSVDELCRQGWGWLEGSARKRMSNPRGRAMKCSKRWILCVNPEKVSRRSVRSRHDLLASWWDPSHKIRWRNDYLSSVLVNFKWVWGRAWLNQALDALERLYYRQNASDDAETLRQRLTSVFIKTRCFYSKLHKFGSTNFIWINWRSTLTFFSSLEPQQMLVRSDSCILFFDSLERYLTVMNTENIMFIKPIYTYFKLI